jgi:hypothetical protein
MDFLDRFVDVPSKNGHEMTAEELYPTTVRDNCILYEDVSQELVLMLLLGKT